MELEIFELGPAATNAVLVYDEAARCALLFDTPLGSFDAVTRFCEERELTLEQVLMTHGHWDHMIDLHLFNAAGVPAAGHQDDQLMFEQPGIMSAFAIPGLEFKPSKIDHWLNPGGVVEAIGQSWEVRHVPGHCPGSLVFWCAAEGVAIVGDTIFAGSVGRTDLPGGDTDLLLSSIRKEIYSLPDTTVLVPGHGPRTQVAHEKRTNPFVRG